VGRSKNEHRCFVGESRPRVDALSKALGTARFMQDLQQEFPGLLYVKALRSRHARACIARIDTSEAERMEGVRAVLTGQDAGIPWIYSPADVFSFPARKEVIWAG
jgi:CO/xanthine dehydrogenase Mo-binding subunit